MISGTRRSMCGSPTRGWSRRPVREPSAPVGTIRAMQQLPDWDDDDLPGDETPPEAEAFGTDRADSMERDEGNFHAELKELGPHPSGPRQAASASVSGLSGPHRIRVRDLAMQA